jgi:hypothetical protein
MKQAEVRECGQNLEFRSTGPTRQSIGIGYLITLAVGHSIEKVDSKNITANDPRDTTRIERRLSRPDLNVPSIHQSISLDLIACSLHFGNITPKLRHPGTLDFTVSAESSTSISCSYITNLPYRSETTHIPQKLLR